MAGILERRLEIIAERIADRVIVPNGLDGVPPDLWVKLRHYRPRSVNTPLRNSSMELV